MYKFASVSPVVLLATASFSLLPIISLLADELPQNIQSSLTLLGNTGTKPTCEPTKFVGEPFFTVETILQNQTRDYTFDSAGVPVNIQVFREELPTPVELVLQQELNDTTAIASISRSFESGEPVFEIELRSNNTDRLLIVNPDGRIIAREIPPSALPNRVQKGIQKNLGALQIDKVLQCKENDSTYFTIGLLNGDFSKWVTVDDSGTFSEQEERVSITAVPAPVRTSILNKAGANEHLRILRKVVSNDVFFEIWILQAQKVEFFWVDSSGTMSLEHP
ncbi:MAG: hypothetical protein WCO60_01735 [Verrucomicrobiota bacterium]